MMIECCRGLLRDDLTVAVSGGCDSMAALDFLRRGSRSIRAAFFDHGDEFDARARAVVDRYCDQHGIELVVGSGVGDSKLGPEACWRQARYSWLDSLNSQMVVAHHLDDVAETWIWSAANGTPKLIPAVRRGTGSTYVRPFLTTRRTGFEMWCARWNVDYVDDPANTDWRTVRAKIRRQVMPAMLTINPGLHAMLRRRVKDQYERCRADAEFNGCVDIAANRCYS